MIQAGTISREFLIRLKLHDQPAYRIAQQAGVHPNTLSKLIHGVMPVRADDSRLVSVGKVLGLDSDEVFEPTE